MASEPQHDVGKRPVVRVGAASATITEAVLLARSEVGCIGFGAVRLLSFSGELFSSVTAGMSDAADGLTMATSFAEGVTGYLMGGVDFAQGGYEWTCAPFTPHAVHGLRTAAIDLLERLQ